MKFETSLWCDLGSAFKDINWSRLWLINWALNCLKIDDQQDVFSIISHTPRHPKAMKSLLQPSHAFPSFHSKQIEKSLLLFYCIPTSFDYCRDTFFSIHISHIWRSLRSRSVGVDNSNMCSMITKGWKRELDVISHSCPRAAMWTMIRVRAPPNGLGRISVEWGNYHSGREMKKGREKRKIYRSGRGH